MVTPRNSRNIYIYIFLSGVTWSNHRLQVAFKIWYWISVYIYIYIHIYIHKAYSFLNYTAKTYCYPYVLLPPNGEDYVSISVGLFACLFFCIYVWLSTCNITGELMISWNVQDRPDMEQWTFWKILYCFRHIETISYSSNLARRRSALSGCFFVDIWNGFVSSETITKV